MQEEGLDNSWQRHQRHHQALVAGLAAMGLEMLVPEEERLAQLNAVVIPEGIDDLAVRQQLLAEYNLEIGAGLGAFAGKVWRIGLMGYAANQTNVLHCLSALESALQRQSHRFTPGEAIKAAIAVYQ
ncbi:hypothetical protein [Endozoicomonas sp. GU-1]|uniref:hypothetical protein n=1 Tax=Endozoicomonas sp. GU-1 TaxID=3009078 RepID=UPI002FC32423